MRGGGEGFTEASVIIKNKIILNKYRTFVTILRLPPLDGYGKEVFFMDVAISFVISFAASVIAYFVCKWFDGR